MDTVLEAMKGIVARKLEASFRYTLFSDFLVDAETYQKAPVGKGFLWFVRDGGTFFYSPDDRLDTLWNMFQSGQAERHDIYQVLKGVSLTALTTEKARQQVEAAVLLKKRPWQRFIRT